MFLLTAYVLVKGARCSKIPSLSSSTPYASAIGLTQGTVREDATSIPHLTENPHRICRIKAEAEAKISATGWNRQFSTTEPVRQVLKESVLSRNCQDQDEKRTFLRQF